MSKRWNCPDFHGFGSRWVYLIFFPFVIVNVLSYHVWHRRSGLPGFPYKTALPSNGIFTGIKILSTVPEREHRLFLLLSHPLFIQLHSTT
jgi:hypothetical protein